MKNVIPVSMNGLLAAATYAENGAAKHGAAINLKQNTAEAIVADIIAAVYGRDTHDAGKDVLRTRRGEANDSCKTARGYCTLSRDLLSPILGSQYSEVWDVTGFVGSLEVPKDADGLLLLTQKFTSYYTANPAYEVAVRNITAAQAQTLYEGLRDARNAVNTQITVVDDLMTERDKKFDALRKRLRGLIDELNQLIDPLDARWLAFGLNKPGAEETPDTPEGLTVTLIGPTAAALKWKPSARAAYYRIWKKVDGVDTELIAVGNPADLDFTIENLPPNSTIQIAVSAVNDGGESEPCHAITITTH